MRFNIFKSRKNVQIEKPKPIVKEAVTIPTTKREDRTLEGDKSWEEVVSAKKKKCKDCATFLRGLSWIHGVLPEGTCYKNCRKGTIHENDIACYEYEINTPENIKKWNDIKADADGDEETYGHAF